MTDTSSARPIDHEIDAVIAGDRSRLAAAFVWSETPEGHHFWSTLYCNDVPINADVIEKLQRIKRERC